MEFETKKKAKKVFELFNGQQVGGKKSNPWYNCIWSMRYLSGINWSDIKDGNSEDNSIKRQKLVSDLNQTKREADVFEKFSKLSKQIEKGSKNKSNKSLTYAQVGSENIVSGKVAKKAKDKQADKSKPKCLKDMPEVLAKLFTGGRVRS